MSSWASWTGFNFKSVMWPLVWACPSAVPAVSTQEMKKQSKKKKSSASQQQHSEGSMCVYECECVCLCECACVCACASLCVRTAGISAALIFRLVADKAGNKTVPSGTVVYCSGGIFYNLALMTMSCGFTRVWLPPQPASLPGKQPASQSLYFCFIILSVCGKRWLLEFKSKGCNIKKKVPDPF